MNCLIQGQYLDPGERALEVDFCLGCRQFPIIPAIGRLLVRQDCLDRKNWKQTGWNRENKIINFQLWTFSFVWTKLRAGFEVIINCVLFNFVLLASQDALEVIVWVSQSVSELLTLRTELTDVTLVSEDTYCRLYQWDSGDWWYSWRWC